MVLAKPELAKSQHKYGNGCKSVKEGAQYCINPDLSETGRRDNFEGGKIGVREKRDLQVDRTEERETSTTLLLSS